YKEWDVEPVDAAELWARSDVLTIHLSRNKSTIGLYSGAVLDRLKPGVILVNCARGAIVDEHALKAGSKADTSPPPRSTCLRPNRQTVTRCWMYQTSSAPRISAPPPMNRGKRCCAPACSGSRKPTARSRGNIRLIDVKPSAPFPKFVVHRGTLRHELRKQKGH